MKNITIIVFFLLVALFVIISILTAYVFIRYGRSKHLAVITTLVFGTIFFFGVLATFLTLQNIF